MSFNRGGRREGGFRGGRGGSGNRFGGRTFAQGPPDHVTLLGHYSYSCEGDLVCKVEIENVPYFNSPIFLENKEQIGKIDEIFGTIRDYSVTVKLSENINPKGFKLQQKLFIDPGKLLPLTRFLPKPPQQKGGKKKSQDIGVGSFRGGRGGNSHSRGGGGFNKGGVGKGFIRRGAFNRVGGKGSGFKRDGGGRGNTRQGGRW
ncbi:probable H/ACA ribonucleoprotein complex subunit 1 [Ceratitis capitata]|uniref:probable H/ACA ribonucleoprotein complex subunit 1 n=1 Tax=Ceratitis capitata TaxID=7213 RepID=UPI00032A0EFA|nr:probable H/ACA ribonucleoprotein complex subunit 1 [Ceratitis capitata]